MRHNLTIIVPISVCLLVGIISFYLQQSSLQDWYSYLHTSPYTLPLYVFPIVWTVVYALMGLSLGLYYYEDNYMKKFFTSLFSFQLFLNLMWSIGFFFLESTILGFFFILLLNIIIIFYAYLAWQIIKWSAILFVPYILWVTYLSYLTVYIYLFN